MLICIGEILVDIFIDGNQRLVMPGGAPFNVACNALLYTKEVSFIGAVGKDANGDMLINFAKEKPFTRLKIKQLEDKETSRAIVSLIDGERSFHFERDNGADYLFSIKDMDFSLLKDDDIVHIGSLMLSYPQGVKFFHTLIRRIRECSHAKISFDINYRDDIFPNPNEAKKTFINALKEADILKFSIEELELLTSKKDILESLEILLNDKQIAVITLGKDGSIFYHNHQLIKVDTYQINPVDTTGAGDAFYSYLLASLINHPHFIDDKNQINYYLKRANIVGGLTTLKKGAINSAPSEIQIDEFLKSK